MTIDKDMRLDAQVINPDNVYQDVSREELGGIVSELFPKGTGVQKDKVKYDPENERIVDVRTEMGFDLHLGLRNSESALLWNVYDPRSGIVELKRLYLTDTDKYKIAIDSAGNKSLLILSDSLREGFKSLRRFSPVKPRIDN